MLEPASGRRALRHTHIKQPTGSLSGSNYAIIRCVFLPANEVNRSVTVRLKKGVYALIRIPALILPLLACALTLVAEDWPQFRGTGGTGL